MVNIERTQSTRIHAARPHELGVPFRENQQQKPLYEALPTIQTGEREWVSLIT
jgi:hypothetical protein